MIERVNDIRFPVFPPTSSAKEEPEEYQGLLASGGDVTPAWLDTAYSQGIFPWSSPNQERLWWSPVPRAVITPESFRLPRTVRKQLKKEHCITTNMAFRQVMQACIDQRKKPQSTWISAEMVDGYSRMHQAGRGFSGEYWNDEGHLCGGFYGILIGRAFFGESMFSKISNASKLAFATIAPILFEHGIEVIDCQMKTDHLAQFGLIELNRDEFEKRLSKAVNSLPIKPLPSVL